MPRLFPRERAGRVPAMAGLRADQLVLGRGHPLGLGDDLPGGNALACRALAAVGCSRARAFLPRAHSSRALLAAPARRFALNLKSMSSHPHDIILRAPVSTDALSLRVLAMQVYLDTYARNGIRPSIAQDVLDTFTHDNIVTWLSEARSSISVAERAGHLVGFAHVILGSPCALAPGGSQAELLRLYVQEPFTARGVGSALLRAAEALALSGGADALWLTPWAGNERALRFYDKHGYTDHGQTWYEIEGELIENRVYAKPLALGCRT